MTSSMIWKDVLGELARLDREIPATIDVLERLDLIQERITLRQVLRALGRPEPAIR